MFIKYVRHLKKLYSRGSSYFVVCCHFLILSIIAVIFEIISSSKSFKWSLSLPSLFIEFTWSLGHLLITRVNFNPNIYMIIAKNIRYLRWNRSGRLSFHSMYLTIEGPSITGFYLSLSIILKPHFSNFAEFRELYMPNALTKYHQIGSAHTETASDATFKIQVDL